MVINDGSTDRTLKIAKTFNVTVLDHMLNRGLGGALGTGLQYAKLVKADIAVTFDADGQHLASDVKKVIKPLLAGDADFVIGSRMLKSLGMPLERKLVNFIANVLTYILWGIYVSDSQSGLRALSKTALKKMQLQTNKMEVSSEFLKEVKRNKLTIREVPIKAIYTTYSKTKGQKVTNSFNIFFKLLLHRLEFLK